MSGLALTVLGCSGSYPGPGGAASGYLVEGGGARVWLDCGSGTLANLQRHVGTDDIDAVVISHAHPDHWIDLLSYFVITTYLHKRAPFPVHAPAEVQRLFHEFHDQDGPFQWQVIADGSTATVGGLDFTFSRSDHPGETFAMRIQDGGGAALGYTADTGPGWSPSELGPGLALLLCEATLTVDKERTVQHLSGRQAGIAAKAAGAERLVLTHVQPGVDLDRQRADAAEAFGGPVEVAAIDERYEL